MISNNINSTPDCWNNYFGQLVYSYTPSVCVPPAWRKPNELIPAKPGCKCNKHKALIIVRPKKRNDNCCNCDHPHHHYHFGLPCFNQHKPYGIATTMLIQSPFYDDDRPDWHQFQPKNRKPRVFEEVIDDKGCSRGPHGSINVRPVEPDIETLKSEEIEDAQNI